MNDIQTADIENLVKEVGQFQLTEQKKLATIEVEEKSVNQLVSYVDINSEKMLVNGLQKITPQCGFVTEEETIESGSETHQWIIDPLDGTTNFLFNHMIYSISIAYQVNGKTKFGVVYVPSLNEYFMANEQGAFLNGKNICVSDKSVLEQSLIATGFPYYHFAELEEYIAVLKDLMQHTKGLRRMGSAAIDLVYTAMGRFDSFFELNLNSWDIAAGAFIVQQAGGTVSDFKGGTNYRDGKRIVASNAHLHTQMLQVLQNNGL